MSHTSDFWVEITAKHCHNRSINIAYSVPKCGDSARYLICGNVRENRYWCPELLKEQKGLPLKGNLSITVETYQKGKDSNYNVGVMAFGNPSLCRAARTKKNEVFNFKDCPDPATPQITLVQSTASPVEITSTKSYDLQTKAVQLINFNVVIVSVVITIFILVCLLAAAMILHKKFHPSDSQNTFSVPNKNICESKAESKDLLGQTNQKQTKIYLVFVEDNPFHKDVIFAFANFLQEDLGFQVIFEPWETQKASQNYSIWMQNSLESAEKIIVVWSDKSPEKVKAFMENEGRDPDTFSPIVQHMQSDLFKYRQVRKYSLVYFGYSDKESIPQVIFNKKEFRHFELMKDFEKLYFHLIDAEQHKPGQCISIPKVQFQTLFESNLNKYGPFLKKAINRATTQIPLLPIEDNELVKTATDNGSSTSMFDASAPLFPKVTDASILQRSWSLPSVSTQAEFCKKRPLSVASIDDINYSCDPYYLLQEVNIFTQLQKSKCSRQLESEPRCIYHNNLFPSQYESGGMQTTQV